MVEDVITLPLRLGVSATRLGLRLAGEAVNCGLHVTARVAEVVVSRPDETFAPDDTFAPAEPAAPAPPPPAPEPAPAADAAPAPEPATPPRVPRVPPPVDTSPPEPPPPVHVSREAELVEEFAEPGAEDGAGAAVRVAEPWNGYHQMTANEVIDRLAAAGREELAAVTLYENAHRRRRTVLAAADRRLRAATASAR
jgi:hypothetical protein